ncbi:hypothetical protein ACHAPO_006766 [Fusarium lateritium]
MLTESNKLDDTCTDTIVLDKLCKFCKVLELDDASYGGETKKKENGSPFVDFGEVVETQQDRIATSGSRVAMAIKALSYVMPNHDVNAPKTVAKTELGLLYLRNDELPDLPALGDTAEGDDDDDDDDDDEEEEGDWNEADCHRESNEKGEGQKEEERTHGNADETDRETKEDQQELLMWNMTRYISAVESNAFVDTDDNTDAEENKEEDAKVETSDEKTEGIGAERGKKREEEVKTEAVEQFRSPAVAPEVLPSKAELVITEITYKLQDYCWGSGNAALKQLMTTNGVLQKHLDEIPMENVPLTVADSIRVCRALDIRYLSVDALCILQGDRDDWSNESFQMSNIYENSYLTLCVVQGNSCSSGFLYKDYGPPNVRVKFQSKLNNSVSGNITLRMLHPPSATVRRCTKQVGKYGPADDSAGNSDINEVSWSTRGWTFQEDQLAPRKVFFGNLMFHVNHGSQLEAADGSAVWRCRFVRQWTLWNEGSRHGIG